MLCLKPQLGAHHPYLRRMNDTFSKFDAEMRKVAASTAQSPVSGFSPEKSALQAQPLVQQPPSRRAPPNEATTKV